MPEVNRGVRTALGIPEDYELVHFGIMGYPKEEVDVSFPQLSDVSFANRWGDPMVAQRLVSNATIGHDSGANSSTASVSVWVKYRLYILAILFVIGFLVGYSTWSFNCSASSSFPQCIFPHSSLGLFFAILFALAGAALLRKRR